MIPSSKLPALALVTAGFVLPMLAARLSRSVVGAGFKAVHGEDPPRNPAAPGVDWRDAVVWTLATGAVGGLSRLAVRKALAHTSIPAEGYDMQEQANDLA